MPVRDVSAWPVKGDEPLGASEKVWLRDPEDSHPTRGLWLFKPVVVHQNGHPQRGDFSERISEALALALGVPTAQTCLARYNKRFGTLSRNVRPSTDWDVYTGSLWLIDRASATFRGRPSGERRSFTDGYTLEAIRTALTNTGAPPDGDRILSGFDGFDVFAGVMLLDAITSNRDRHEQNWSILLPNLGTGGARLAAIYDNESSLGFNLTDGRRAQMLSDSAMFDAYRRRATAWRFDWLGSTSPTLIDAASRCLSMVSEPVRSHWRTRLQELDGGVIKQAVDSAMGMSEVSRTFTTKLIHTNVEELRHAIRE